MCDPIEALASNPDIPLTVRAKIATAEPLYSSEDVDFCVDQLAVRLTLELQDQNPVVLCILQGGLTFTGMLMRRLVFPLEQGFVHAGSYADDTVGGAVEVHAHGGPSLQGRVVLLVDDVLDRGETLKYLSGWAKDNGAVRVESAVLVTKRNPQPQSWEVTFSALSCDSRFLIGCGLDIAGYGRNLPGIYALA